MNILKPLSLSLFLLGATVSTTVSANNAIVSYAETPAKTIVLKHPAAANVNTYFSSATMFQFEVYKAGSKADVTNIINKLKQDGNVESVTEGPVTGDYQAITISIKTAKDKAYFVALMKKAGLNNIKINNNPVVSVDQL